MYEGLSKSVYKERDLEEVENVRVVCGLHEVLQQVKDRGAVAVGQSTTTEKFLKAATYIDPSIEIRCDMAEMRRQFKLFLRDDDCMQWSTCAAQHVRGGGSYDQALDEGSKSERSWWPFHQEK